MASASVSVSTPITPQATVPEEPSWLTSLLAPRCIAVIGADTEGSGIGETVLANLLANPFDGMVFPVSATHRGLQGVRTVESLTAIPERIDLAIIAGAPDSYPEAISACGVAGVASAILVGAGLWPKPLAKPVEQRVCAAARHGRVRLLGPDSLGVVNPVTGFNGSILSTPVKSGGIAFLSQSGSLCSTIVDWARQEGFGFSGIVSLGTMIDIGWGELIEHFGNDQQTRAILLAVDDLGDVRSFLSAARIAAIDKPIIVLRGRRLASVGGRSSGGLTFEAEEMFDALLDRAGVLRVDSITDLFGAADLLGNQPRPKGKRLAIVTNAGNPGLRAADVVVGGGNEIATLGRDTMTALSRELDVTSGVGAGVGVLADPTPSCFAAAARLAAQDPGCDGVLLILSPQGRTEPTPAADLVIDQLRGVSKPVFASWMGGPAVEEGRRRLHAAGIPHFEFPEAAARAWNTSCSYGERIRMLYETPDLGDEDFEVPDRARVQRILTDALHTGRTTLTPIEVGQVLTAYHLVAETAILGITDHDAVCAAESLGLPVMLTPHRGDDPGSCRRDDTLGHLVADSAAAVHTAFHALRSAVEDIRGADAFSGVWVTPLPPGDGQNLTLAMEADHVFGPVVGLGLGGVLGTVYADHSYALPPLTVVLAKRLLDQVQFARFLQGQSNADAGAVLAQTLVRFSHLVVEHPRIKSIVIDSLSLRDGGLLTHGAHVELHGPTVANDDLPRPLVRPCPSHYGSRTTLRDGTPVELRPVRPEDETAFVRLHEQLSADTVRSRYATDVPLSDRIAHARLVRRCQIDYDREIALVAEVVIPGIGKDLIGVGRLSRSHVVKTRAAINVLVADRWQSEGVDAVLLDALLSVAPEEVLTHLTADVPADKPAWRQLLARRGFVFSDSAGPLKHADLLLG